MALFTLLEIIDLIIMVLAIGFIFSRLFRRKPVRSSTYEPLDYYTKKQKKSYFWEDLKYGIIIAAPAVVFHELAHKFAAIGFGATATLHAPYLMYAIAIALVLFNSPLVFFVGGYVSHTALAALPSAIVAFAGPFVNLVFWLGIKPILKTKYGKKHMQVLLTISRLNMFLFIFNMIPIPGFDGFQFFEGIIRFFMGG
jgi:Zn-dependent protease